MAKAPAKRKTTKKVTTENTSTPRTLAEKLAAAERLVEKYKREMVLEQVKNDVRSDDVIRFQFGRGDKKRELTGTVTGTKTDDTQGLMIRAVVGEGFDAETYKVFARDVIQNITGDERRTKEEEEAPASTDADPLNAE